MKSHSNKWLICLLISALLCKVDAYTNIRIPLSISSSKLHQPKSISFSHKELMQIDSMNTVDETWKQLEDFGTTLTRYEKSSMFIRALAAGIFVGFGGILSASVGCDMGKSVWYLTNEPLTLLCFISPPVS
jgi:hypothetical protein